MGITAGIAGVASAASGILGGIRGGNAAKSAANQQAAANQAAIDFQQNVYNTTQSNLKPYIGGGTNALAALSQLYGLPAPAGTNLPAGNALSAYQAYTQTPFYQFPLSQGIEALNRSGAARGLSLSGGQANALQKYGQDYGSTNFNSYISALANLANVGQNAAVGVGSQGNQASGTILSGQQGVGNANAAGTIGAQNQQNNALSQIPMLLKSFGGLGGSGSGNGSSYGSFDTSGALASYGAYSPNVAGAADTSSALPINFFGS